MADERKHFSKMTFNDLDKDALDEHAESLGEKEGIAALDYLDELEDALIDYTLEMEVKERKTLRKRLKREKVEAKDENEKVIKDKDGNTTYTWIKTERLYTDAEIEEKIAEKKAAGKVPMPFFTQKWEYCNRYWKEKLPQKQAAKDKNESKNKRAAIRERLRSGKK